MSNCLDLASNLAKEWIEGLDSRPVASAKSRKELESVFRKDLPETGMRAEEVVAWLYEKAAPGMLGSSSGRFFAWVIGGGLESALAADWLVSTWDQNAALFACSPSASVIEEAAGEWIKELLDLPREASFAFTTGCQLAHTTALAAARYSVLKRDGWDVEEEGMLGAPRVTVISSDQKHGSVERTSRLLGFGRRVMQTLKTDDSGRITLSEFASALDNSPGPKIVVLNAADLNVGAFDPFSELIPLAREAGAWVHVDGAFGLFARASRQHRAKLDGVEMADSWATDAHKWLNVPFDCGISIVRDREAHRASMTLSASYISSEAGARDQIDWNPEWSRRARGIPVYAALKELGRAGVESMVDRCCAHCQAIVSGIAALPGAVVLVHPTLNQGLIRFSKSGNTPEQDDEYTDLTIQAINDTGEAFFSGTTWRGRRAMRVSVVNWRTSARDVKRGVAAVASVLARGSG